MRLRTEMRRLLERIARRIALLFGRPAASEPLRARPVDAPARRFTAVRPGPFSASRGHSDRGEARHDSRDDVDDVFVAPDPEPLPFGDFADRGEAERFAILPPIGAGAADDVDWDELARALTGER
jgi:hypothetical protein